MVCRNKHCAAYLSDMPSDVRECPLCGRYCFSLESAHRDALLHASQEFWYDYCVGHIKYGDRISIISNTGFKGGPSDNFSDEMTFHYVDHGHINGKSAPYNSSVGIPTCYVVDIKKLDYDGTIPGYGDVMTVEAFTENVEEAAFIDNDGHGYPCKDGKMMSNLRIIPSQIQRIPNDATHIVWFNR
jgi:hypothetical protein